MAGLVSIASERFAPCTGEANYGDPHPVPDRPRRPSAGRDHGRAEPADRGHDPAGARPIEPGPRSLRSDRNRDPRPLPAPGRPDDRQSPGRGDDLGESGRAREKGAAGGNRSRRPPETRRLKLRLLGGLVLWIATIYCGPKARSAQGRGREGTGSYPELAALGIRKGATPALQSRVGRLSALLPSIELAREELRSQGPRLDEKTVHRMARQLGAEVLTTRTRDLQRFRDGLLPAGQLLAGRHVVAQVDGGRVRIRTQVQIKKRKGVKDRRKIRVEWREPKLLILSKSDGKGRMLRGTCPWIDGTLQGPDHAMELLAMHLHRLGAAGPSPCRSSRTGHAGSGTGWTGSSPVRVWTQSGSSGCWISTTRCTRSVSVVPKLVGTWRSMDARPLRRMTLGHRVITGGSHASTPSYPQPQPSPPPRRRAPASPSEVQGLQTQDLGSGPLVAVARRRRTHHLAVRRLPAAPRRPLRRDGAQGAAGHLARLRHGATTTQCRAGRAPAQDAPQADPAAGHRPDLDLLPRQTVPGPRGDLPRSGQGRHQPLPRLRHRVRRPPRAAVHCGPDRRQEGRAPQRRGPTPAPSSRARRCPAPVAPAGSRVLQRGRSSLPAGGALSIPDAGGLPRPLAPAARRPQRQ